MNIAQRKQLASLLADRVKDKADRDDTVGMFRAASMLDQVNEEIREVGETAPEDAKAEPAAGATGRRVFVHG